jgi:acetylornithine deacetylase/succinyl-diaminopimelate desuccinylase-like protein
MRDAALDYARRRRQSYLEALMELLRIPSVSTLPEHRADVQRAADWVCAWLEAAGFSGVEQWPTPGNAVVFAEWNQAGPGAPTLLLYGHYDVQPVDPVDLWESPPFEPTIRGENLYCRGVADDKGLFFAMLAGMDAYLQTAGRLPLNVKVLLEGEEEVSSPHIGGVIRERADRLACDACVISDQPMFSPELPAICYGVRGNCYLEVELVGPAQDMHSGMVGGVVENPFNALVRMLAPLQDGSLRIQIPGFYDRVRVPDEEERRLLARSPVDEAMVRRVAGVRQAAGEPEFTLAERVSVRPTLEICGMPGGFTGPGRKSVIPSKAAAKLNLRLVPDQDPVEIEDLVERFLREIQPPTVELTVRRLGHAHPVVFDYKSPAIQAADRAYQLVFGHSAVYFRGGGSLPVVHDVRERLGAPVAMIGFGLPDDNIHAPNERLRLSQFFKGVETAIHYYTELPVALAAASPPAAGPSGKNP